MRFAAAGIRGWLSSLLPFLVGTTGGTLIGGLPFWHAAGSAFLVWFIAAILWYLSVTLYFGLLEPGERPYNRLKEIPPVANLAGPLLGVSIWCLSLYWESNRTRLIAECLMEQDETESVAPDLRISHVQAVFACESLEVDFSNDE